MRPVAFVLFALCAGAGFAQPDEWYAHHNFTIGGGAALPQMDIRGPLEDAPHFSIAYGYRFARYFQAESGMDVGFGAAGVHDYLVTDLGYQRIRDRQYFVPFGGRAILPFKGERFWIAGGGGGAYLRYGESLHQPSQYYHVDCPVCTSRSGWGYYALVNAGFALDRARHFRLGVTGKTYRADTEGEPLGGIPATKTRDKWLMFGVDFGFSF